MSATRDGQGTIHKHAAHERRGAGCQGGEAAQLFGPRADRPESPDPRGGAPTKAAISIQSEVEPTSTAVLIREYGVIHIKNALTMEQQTRFWKITKPRRRSCRPGHKGFQLCSVRKEWLTNVFDTCGKMLAAEELVPSWQPRSPSNRLRARATAARSRRISTCRTSGAGRCPSSWASCGNY